MVSDAVRVRPYSIPSDQQREREDLIDSPRALVYKNVAWLAVYSSSMKTTYKALLAKAGFCE